MAGFDTLTRLGPTTTELMHAARRGDTAAWDQLVRRFDNVVSSTVRRYRLQDADARDAAQRTWLRLVEHHRQLQNPEALGGWLATTAARECLQILRGRQWMELRAEAHDVVDPAGEPETRVVDAVTVAQLRRLMARLPPRSRILLDALFEDDPLPYAELSRRTGIPIGSIGPTRARALRHLRVLIDEHSPRTPHRVRCAG
jgi:RNA polymerase sigma factor (sigma-70 family)